MAIDAAAPPSGRHRAESGTPRPPKPARGRWIGVLVPVVLVAVAATLRFTGLDHPDRIYFDEAYYANDAAQMLRTGVEEEFAVHPPLGKWLIAAGISVAGFDPFGWRTAAAAAGTASVLLCYLVALRLFRRRGVAALAAFLLAIDGLAFTTSRIAMLDGFLTMFVLLGVYLLVLDRDVVWAAAPAGDDQPEAALPLPPVRPLPLRGRHWRWLAGVAFGLALATKWSAVLAIGAAGVFLLVSELAWRRRITGSRLTQLRPALTGTALALVALPAGIYLASYAPWFANFADTVPGRQLCPDGVCEVSVPQMLASWWDQQADIYEFHRDLEAEHPYRAPAWTWPLLTRPVAYYYEDCTESRQTDGDCAVAPDHVAEIMGLGNPAIWWAALVFGYPVVAWGALRRRDWRAWTILAFLLGQYVPWLFATRPVFLFYMAPGVPFICLALAYACREAQAVRWLRWLPVGLAAVAVAAFLFWYPLYVGAELPRGDWWLRIWVRPGWV